jgi:ABC-type transport system substrate-binding protein
MDQTFTLRSGRTKCRRIDLTADDVVFTFVARQERVVYTPRSGNTLTSVKATDPKTVEFKSSPSHTTLSL